MNRCLSEILFVFPPTLSFFTFYYQSFYRTKEQKKKSNLRYLCDFIRYVVIAIFTKLEFRVIQINVYTTITKIKKKSIIVVVVNRRSIKKIVSHHKSF